MNLDEELFALDAESRDLLFGPNGMGDRNHPPSQPYDASPMETDSQEILNLLGQMPTPVSTNLRASDAQAYMSPLQVDHIHYDRMSGIQFPSHGNEETYFTPLLSPAVTPMDIIRLHENENMNSAMDSNYFSPLSSPTIERFPASQTDPRRPPSIVTINNMSTNRRAMDNTNDIQRNVRAAPYSPVARPSLNRKRHSITHLNLNNASPSDHSSDSVSPEPLPSSMPPPPPRCTSSSRLSDKSSNGKSSKNQRQKHTDGTELAPATPSSFLNLNIQNSGQQQQGGNPRVESTITFDNSTDTSPATVKSASSTPTFGPTAGGQSIGSPLFISIPASYDPNSIALPNATLTASSNARRPIRGSRGQGHSAGSSPAFKPIISTNLKPLLPGASKSNYQNILEGNHNQLGLTYPKELSSGIEYRRTSHKVAEQARRSRINNAIDQLGTLLPGETEGISKAITVEKAIDYIKNLEEQLAKAKAELAAKQ